MVIEVVTVDVLADAGTEVVFGVEEVVAEVLVVFTSVVTLMDDGVKIVVVGCGVSISVNLEFQF